MTAFHPVRAPTICTQKAQKPNFRIWSYFSIFGKKKYFASNVPYVCRYLAIALGYESPTSGESFDRHFIPPKNSNILARFYLRN